MMFQEQKRLIEQDNISIECCYYGIFKSPGLKNYPIRQWVNDDYNLIKQSSIKKEVAIRLATNLFVVGKKYNLFENLDYFIMMPKKTTSITSLEVVISELIKIIKQELNKKVILLANIFHIDDYRKFWENRLKINERKNEIANKIHLLPQYKNSLNNKNIIIIDDVVASGISIAQVVREIIFYNNCTVKALCYGSVYKWEEIYQ